MCGGGGCCGGCGLTFVSICFKGFIGRANSVLGSGGGVRILFYDLPEG